VSNLWLTLGWLLYALLHSLLSSFAAKDWIARRLPNAMPYYRLAFNFIAGITALPLAWLIHAFPGETLWRWSEPWVWLANGLALAAIAGLLVSSRAYAMDEFLGLRQLRSGATQVDNRAGFTLSFFHRFVRHPWYLFGLIIVWTRDMNEAWLVSAIAITLYFTIGSWFEERKLVALHGEAYRRYMERVPGLLPLPWKYLKAEETRNWHAAG
jgi:protein-S-isoprenylcysteine O-methyltransferase Ste14